MPKKSILLAALLLLIVVAVAFSVPKLLANALMSDNVRSMRQMAKADRLSDTLNVASNLQSIPTADIHRAEAEYQKVLVIDPTNQQAMARLVWLACLDRDTVSRDMYLTKIKSLPQHDGPLREAEGYIQNYKDRTSTIRPSRS